MNNYEFKSTNLITETFEERDIKYRVEKEEDGIECVSAGFPITGGHNVIMKFVSYHDENDVTARAFAIVSSVPAEKRSRVLEACNILNCKIRYLKFQLDSDGDVNVECDFPLSTPDEAVGEVALEVFVRSAHILNSEYSIFMKALYTDEELNPQEQKNAEKVMERIRELRDAIMKRLEEDGIELDEDDELNDDDEPDDDNETDDEFGLDAEEA